MCARAGAGAACANLALVLLLSCAALADAEPSPAAASAAHAPLELELAVAVAAAAAIDLDLAERPAPGVVGFDLFILVRQYGPSYCLHSHCTSVPVAEMTLHGLWPNNGAPERHDGISGFSPARLAHCAAPAHRALPAANGTFPQFCPEPAGAAGGGGEPYDAAREHRRRCVWPSASGPCKDFWEHEWRKHGTCAAPLLGARGAYFRKALDLHSRYEVNAALAGAGAAAGGAPVPATRVAAALGAAAGAAPRLACAGAALAEVWLCLGLDLAPRDCPEHVRPESECSAESEVQLPPGGAASAECSKFFPPPAAPLAAAAAAPHIAEAVPAAAAPLALVVAAAAALAARRRRRAPPAGYAGLPSDP
jgi:ribonuclease T2